MKKIIILSLLFLSANFGFCQKPAIEKIGGFRMYDSAKALLNMGFTDVAKIISQKDLIKFSKQLGSNKKNIVAEYIYDPTAKQGIYEMPTYVKTYRSSKVRSFVVYNLELIPDLILDGVALIYLNDSLVSFRTNSIANIGGGGLIALSNLLSNKYDFTQASKDVQKTHEGSLSDVNEIISLIYKTNNPHIQCIFSSVYIENTFGKAKSLQYELRFEDVKKIFEINNLELEFEKGQVIKKYDINKL